MITKGVILCGGYATRFMPACKGIPKEMLPLYNTPILQILVDDLIDNGVTEIMFVLRRGKESIIDHFTRVVEMEKVLLNKDKQLVNSFKKYNKIKFYFVRQNFPRGTGDALETAKGFCSSPFYLLNGDEIIINPVSLVTQLKLAYEKTYYHTMALQEVEINKISNYGIVRDKFYCDNICLVEEIVEKPSIENAPSNVSNLGAYVFNPSIFSYIDTTVVGQIPITTALNKICENHALYGVKIIGKRYDMGNPLGYVLSNLDYCYNNPQTRNDVINYINLLGFK